MTPNLTPRQREVLRLMANGWELGCDPGYRGRKWLQRGGIGSGLDTRPVHGQTLDALSHRLLVRQCGTHAGIMLYELTPAGRAAVESEED